MALMPRPTIADIARACGVSPTAVSFALNGRPGVSEPRRAEILAKADELGWTPSAAARALSTSHVGAIGLIIALPAATISRDTFYLQLIAGIESALQGSGDALMLTVVADQAEELAAMRRWQAEHRVDAVVLVNPLLDDPRPALARELELPCVFVGDVRDHEGASGVLVDDAAVMRGLLQDLRELGHHRVAYLHRRSGYRHDRERLRALAEAGDEGILEVREVALAGTGGDSVAEAVAELLREGLPEVLIGEDEGITLALLAALHAAGARVGVDVGVVSWETSAGLVMRSPAIASIDRDPMVLGAAAVRVLRRLEAGEAAVNEELEPPRLVVRESLAPVAQG